MTDDALLDFARRAHLFVQRRRIPVENQEDYVQEMVLRALERRTQPVSLRIAFYHAVSQLTRPFWREVPLTASREARLAALPASVSGSGSDVRAARRRALLRP